MIRPALYEYRNGEPTWLSAGMLIESMRIAATAWQRDSIWQQDASDTPATLTVRFPRTETSDIDPLLSFLTLRSVDRTPYRRRHLSATEKAALDACLSDGLTIDWHETARMRWRIAGLSAVATDIRLRCPEVFETHRRIIDWDRALSPTGIPAQCAGLARPTLPADALVDEAMVADEMAQSPRRHPHRRGADGLPARGRQRCLLRVTDVRPAARPVPPPRRS